MSMTPIFWPEFFVLFAAMLCGTAAVMPYALKLLRKQGESKPLRFSMPVIVLLSFMQTALLSAIAVGGGLLAAHAVGLGAPYIEAALAGESASGVGQMIFVTGIAGAIAGLLLLFADLVFLPHWPQALVEATLRTTSLDNFLASFYGGINEEIFIRLFGLSALLWLASLIFHDFSGGESAVVLWSANIIMTLVFGAGHLPSLKAMLGTIPPLMVARSLLLNAPIGLLCGWLFWTYGIEAAIIAHFSADIVYHVLGTMLLRRKLTALSLSFAG